MTYTYTPQGVCSHKMLVELDDNGVIKALIAEGGCSGNLKGYEKILCGLNAEDVIGKLKGIECGYRSTSCPDQMSIALTAALKQLKSEKASS